MNEERKMILMMLQEGKITADEAERLIKAISQPAEAEAEEKQDEEKKESSLSEFVDWKNWKDRRQNYQQPSGGFRISQYIESFIQKLKDVDLDFNFGSYETVNHIFQERSFDFNNISIDVKNGSVKLLPWKEESVQVNCDVRVYRVSNLDEARERFLREARFEVINQKLVFACEPRDLKVMATVYIPAKMYDEITVTLFNGDIEGKSIETKELHAKTVNGSLSFSELLSEKAELETGNGTIQVDGKVNDFEAETLNGPIRAKGAFRDVEAETFSGMITVENTEPGVVSLKSTTGSIRMVTPRGMQINGELVTAVGSIHCDLHAFDVLREKKEMAQRLLKFVSNKGADSLLTLEANTKTGTITVVEQGE